MKLFLLKWHIECYIQDTVHCIVTMMIHLFYRGDREMARDFTYVDDVTTGVIASMKYEPKQCGQVLNIGHGSPAVVRQMIAILEEELNITARIVTLYHFFRFFDVIYTA